ncbi:MAG: threonine--tRNA ligase [Verrucomicrobia bacterium]|nr:threonine--tRNA ligase [Verrucomicrobiota bacterium]MCH8510653.1 threonine--tRNA ligase [Kiritimatiellia bacterium]
MHDSPVVKDELYRIRHSLAHVMAQAVLEIRPDAKLGFGPPIDTGFYYDFIFTQPITDADFKDIEKRMRKIINQDQAFTEENLPYDEAMVRLDEMGEPYKKEYARELFDKKGIESLRFYRNGPFLDMCEGPHVPSTKAIPADGFKLRSIAGAYWRGDSRKAMMTRIYAWAYPSKEDLKAAIQAHEEALKRDHKKLGKELKIFRIDEQVGKGLPLWLPNGTVIRDQLQRYVEELEFHAGYRRVATPHLAKTSLYHTTGHLPYYKDGMFPFMEIKETSREGGEVVDAYVLKPMNCPHHHLIYASEKHSYRDLPLRLAEYGQCHRYEDSGSLSGLLRVRAMCMNDAHIYCTEDQIEAEFLAVMEMHKTLYAKLGIKDYYMRLSTFDPDDPKGKQKYVDNPEAWIRSQDLVRAAMEQSGLPFKEVMGEAAFYGPKIDFQFKSVTGREETASTNQLDFAVPPRMNLVYTDKDNTEKHPYVIHRAPAGTHERFIAFLLEHFGGAFPTWLAPLQVQVITVSDDFREYAERIVSELRKHMVRAELDPAHDTMGKKIRNASKAKIPNVLIIGEKERADGTVTWRRFGVEEQETLPADAFQAEILRRIRERELDAAKIY